jgi:hypothetical protein
MKNVIKSLSIVAGFVGMTNEAMSATPFHVLTSMTTTDVLAYGLVGVASATHAALSSIVTTFGANEIMSYGVSLVMRTLMHFMF